MTVIDLDLHQNTEKASTPPALQLDGVRHSYGRTVAVDGVSVSVAPGEVVCLLGPSGCGKTTMLRIAAGLEALQDGEIRLAGTMVAGPGVDVPPERRGVGLVFQDYALFPHLDVLDNVAFGLTGWTAADRRSRAESVLALVGMNDYAAAFPHNCPVASSSELPWPGRWRRGRGSCCWTSRIPGWMPGCATVCGMKCCIS